jgi:Periplasmic component of the Tol biopolymer transport system
MKYTFPLQSLLSPKGKHPFRHYLILCSIFLLCSKLYPQFQKDSLAIIQLLEKEGLTWRMGDIEAHAACWAERPYGSILISTTDGRSLDLPSKAIIEPSPEMVGKGGFAFHFNHQMRINDSLAWVRHDEVSVSIDGKESLTHELRLLEKLDGQWKMVGQSLHSYNQPPENKIDTTSYIQTVDITTGRIETIKIINEHFEAPNWHPDNYLIVNSKGKLYTLELATKQLNLLDTGFADQCNNDHGISPDNQWLAISHNDKNDPSPKPYKSVIYVLPIGGGTPKRVTPEVVSYWHGWSPDGKKLAYCGERNGNYDIYTIGINGGQETRLTKTEGLDDGPEYSPDGKYIYFNSYRTGHMQIWRMLANGKKPEQLTFDDNSNWFAHPSPDGKWIVYIAYISDEKQNHLFGKQVKLRLMNLENRSIKDITPVFFGGQGTINVPSWSPDSKKIAFVSYSVN